MVSPNFQFNMNAIHDSGEKKSNWEYCPIVSEDAHEWSEAPNWMIQKASK